MSDYIISDSGVRVWKNPESHPLLKHTDTTHPAFLDKLAEIYSKGKVKGLPRICSMNSEDARTWHYFSPLLFDIQKKTLILTRLLSQAFPEAFHFSALDNILCPDLKLWQRIYPPPSRLEFIKEGPSEPDLLIELTQRAVVLVEAKYSSGVSEKTTHDKVRDQVIRLIDVGSWYAKKYGYEHSYVIVLQYGDANTNAEEIVSRYAGKPEAIQQALLYRGDLTEADYQRLSRSVAFVRWPNPLEDEQ
jgi:hypothetical protein